MKKVLFVTSRVSDARELAYRALKVWSVVVPSDPANAPALASTGNFDFALFDISVTGVWPPDSLRALARAREGFRVFILSRERTAGFQDLARKAGAVGYFSIPYSFHRLKRGIDDFFVDTSRSRDADTALDPADQAIHAASSRATPSSGLSNGDDEPRAREVYDRKPSLTRERQAAYGSGRAIKPIDWAFPESSGDTEIEESILGKSDAMEALRSRIRTTMRSRATVLISGETGSGKELVARAIHALSPVSSGPFVACNVSCIAETLAESELFGASKGSFTGAVRDIKGLFEEADGGTLFLDEIGELSLSLQAKFLRVLEDGYVCRLGSRARRLVAFRLVCATNRDLRAMVSARRFRADLYYRLDALRIRVPPLRAHPEDIPALSRRCLRESRKELSAHALETLKGYHWPGNVRQLFNCLERAACETENEVIEPHHIDF